MDLEVVWNIIENYLPDLKLTIEAITEEVCNI
ncbi:MAG: hypothetical protein KME13_08655 [Myxacorys californica WJT36-NPBG1]|nr:hypothetical protein [Myxacorys californica WJT36-NPBG1]